MTGRGEAQRYRNMGRGASEASNFPACAEFCVQRQKAHGLRPGAAAEFGLSEKPTHYQALRTLANRLVGILHGCLKTRTLYDEATAWPHREKTPQSDIAA